MNYYDVKDFDNFSQIIDYCAQTYQDEPAFIQKKNGETVQLTYSEFRKNIMSAGDFLKKSDLGEKGFSSRIGSFVENVTNTDNSPIK